MPGPCPCEQHFKQSCSRFLLVGGAGVEESEGVSSVWFCELSYTTACVRNTASKSLKHRLDDPAGSELASAQG